MSSSRGRRWRQVQAQVQTAMARPRDEIEPEGGPAHQALNLLDALSVSLRRREEARLWRLRAGALSVLGPARDAEAVAAYQEAVLRAPRDGRLHWEAAVYHKWRGRWDEAWRLNAVALARMPSLRGALWTQAQLATVRGDAALATGIWRSLGHGMHAPRCGALPESQVQPTFLVRLPCRPAATGPSFEMLPLQATSPCHGVLTAPTFVAAGIDFGDQLLFDAAPAAWVQQAGVPVPCFPVVALLQRAQVRT
ncbi:MAG: tetratricopeptide repeat protein, partial [Polyangiales bacterium]